MLLLILASFIVAETAGYGVHKFMHIIRSKAHFEHHTLYPTGAYLTDTAYQGPSNLSARLQDVMYAVPGVLYTAAVWYYFGLAAFLVALSVVLFNAYASQYLHNAFHVRGHRLERFDAFWRMRITHWVHHTEDRNFGIISNFTDYFTGSYRSVPPAQQAQLLREWGYEYRVR